MVNKVLTIDLNPEKQKKDKRTDKDRKGTFCGQLEWELTVIILYVLSRKEDLPIQNVKCHGHLMCISQILSHFT